jgi:hypothetical protein
MLGNVSNVRDRRLYAYRGLDDPGQELTPSAPMLGWTPQRLVVYGVVTGVITWGVTRVLEHFLRRTP